MKNFITLKTQNAPIIGVFLSWCMAIFISFYVYSSPENVEAIFNALRTKDALFFIALPLFVVVLSGLISSQNKARLVYWRWDFPLPGHRVFSELIEEDTRIDVALLASRIGQLPVGPREQNNTWYAMYKSVSSNPVISSSHRNFLLLRDMTAYSFVFLVVGSPVLFMLKRDTFVMLGYALTFMVHFAAIAISANNIGNRFACNVICEFVNSKK